MLKIGIIGIYKELPEGEFTRLSFEYSRQVEESGIAIPFIIPSNVVNIDYYVQECDGFIIPGGEDIDPSFYGETISGSIKTQKNNDQFELEFIDKIVKKKKPILGICRGMQLLNVYFSGTLQQNIQSQIPHQQLEKQNEIIHEIGIQKGSQLFSIFGKQTGVNSIHHQAVNLLGKGLEVTARSTDGIIEAIEHSSLPIIGVQWHPEMLQEHSILFKKVLESFQK